MAIDNDLVYPAGSTYQTIVHRIVRLHLMWLHMHT